MVELNRKTYFEVFEKGKYDDPIGFVVFKDGEWKFRQFKKDTHITSDVMRSIADTITNIEAVDDENNIKLYKLARYARDVLYQNVKWSTPDEYNLWLFMKKNGLLAKKDIESPTKTGE